MIRAWPLALAYVAIAVALFALRPAPAPGLAARDFEAYWAAGATWNARGDPYARSIWEAERHVPSVDARRDELLPFIDPPATLPVWSAFARLPYTVASAIWLALLAIALAALVCITLDGSTLPVTRLRLFGGLALALAFGPVTSDLALGQLALPAFVGAALVVAMADRCLPAAAAAAILAFAAPNMALGLISQLNRKRAFAALALGFLVTYGLGAWTAGWNWPLRYAKAAAAQAGAEHFVAIQLSPAAVAYGFGAAPPVTLAIAAVAALLASAMAILIIVRVREPFARFAGCSRTDPFRRGVRSRAQPGRCLSRRSLVRAAHANDGTRARIYRSAARCDQLAGTRTAPEQHCAERAARARRCARLHRAGSALATPKPVAGGPLRRGTFRHSRRACSASSGAGLARRARCFPRAAKRRRGRGLARRAAGERTARGRAGLGRTAHALALRLRAPGVRYISTFIILSNGVTALGWKFLRSLS